MASMDETAPLINEYDTEQSSHVVENGSRHDVENNQVANEPLTPLATHIIDDIDGNAGSKSSAVLLVTIWELGEAVGPLLIAPLSEMYGRRRLFNVANVFFVMATLLGALSQNTAMLLASRVLTGMSVAAGVLTPAVIGDIFVHEQRGAAMSLVMLAPLFASSGGIVFSSVMAERFGWRSVFWITAALGALCSLLFLTSFRETYLIPSRRSSNNLPKNNYTNADERPLSSSSDSPVKPVNLWTSIKRPFAVFIGSGVLASLALFGSAFIPYFYVISVTFPIILEDVYLLSPAQVGLSFVSNGIGSCIGILVCNFSLDRIYVKLSHASKGANRPEYRLPLTIIGVSTIPLAVTLYGWCAQLGLPLSLFLFSAVWIRVSMILAFLPLMPYVVDAFGLYSASALTGVIVARCLAGAWFPLATDMMTKSLGYGLGFTVLGLFSLAIGVIPMLILWYGAQWRQRSKYTRSV